MTRFMSQGLMFSTKLTIPTKYYIARAFSTCFSLIFAIFYTKILGLENRSFISYVMVISLLSSLILNSGLTYSLRFHLKLRIENFKYFIFFGLTTSLLSVFIMDLLLQIYAIKQYNPPKNLTLICLAYGFVSNLHIYIYDFLCSLEEYKNLSKIEYLTIPTQLTLFFGLLFCHFFSTAVNLLLSLIFSYLVNICFATLISRFQISMLIDLEYSRIKQILQASWQYYGFGISITILDRLDKFVVGLFLPRQTLAIYSVSTGLVTPTRFIADAYSRLRVSNNTLISTKRRLETHNKKLVMLVLLLAFLLTLVIDKAVLILFGKHWHLSEYVVFAYILQEIFRFYYIRKILISFEEHRHNLVNWIVYSLIGFGIFNTFVMILLFGLIGAPLSAIISYVIGSVFISRREKSTK